MKAVRNSKKTKLANVREVKRANGDVLVLMRPAYADKRRRKAELALGVQVPAEIG